MRFSWNDRFKLDDAANVTGSPLLTTRIVDGSPGSDYCSLCGMKQISSDKSDLGCHFSSCPVFIQQGTVTEEILNFKWSDL